jgi:prefoldin alpha subunit
LEPQQLAQVKKQLDEELEHLTTSFAQLHAAQNKFKDCLQCVKSRSAAPEGAIYPSSTGSIRPAHKYTADAP